jgi:hypothetical protein
MRDPSNPISDLTGLAFSPHMASQSQFSEKTAIKAKTQVSNEEKVCSLIKAKKKPFKT